MNTQQRSYAIRRIAEIESQRIYAAREVAAVPRPENQLSGAARLKLVREGKVSLRKGAYIGDQISYAFDFSEYTNDTTEKRAAAKKALEEIVNKIKFEAGAIRDQIMLGDAEEAFELITAFAKG